MATRRMVSKSISTSGKVNQLSEFGQLLFTWIQPHTDDFGRLDGDPVIVKAIVMPLSPRKPKDFEKELAHMAELELIHWYKTAGKSVIEVVGFDDHQANLHKRKRSKFPNYEEGASQKLPEILGKGKQAKPPVPENLGTPEDPSQKFRDDSDPLKTAPGTSGKVRLNRTELKGTEQKRTEGNVEHTRQDPVDTIFSFWQEVHKHPKAMLDEIREKAIRSRLKEGYTLERIKQAILGIKQSPHHMGKNEQNTKYDDIELICRNGTNVDKFADLQEEYDRKRKASMQSIMPEWMKEQAPKPISEEQRKENIKRAHELTQNIGRGLS